jgi:hypothetical protein
MGFSTVVPWSVWEKYTYPIFAGDWSPIARAWGITDRNGRYFIAYLSRWHQPCVLEHEFKLDTMGVRTLGWKVSGVSQPYPRPELKILLPRKHFGGPMGGAHSEVVEGKADNYQPSYDGLNRVAGSPFRSIVRGQQHFCEPPLLQTITNQALAREWNHPLVLQGTRQK